MLLNIPALRKKLPLRYVRLKEKEGLRYVPVAAITHIDANDNYTLVHLVTGSSALVRRPLADWERELPENGFMRIGRSL